MVRQAPHRLQVQRTVQQVWRRVMTSPQHVPTASHSRGERWEPQFQSPQGFRSFIRPLQFLHTSEAKSLQYCGEGHPKTVCPRQGRLPKKGHEKLKPSTHGQKNCCGCTQLLFMSSVGKSLVKDGSFILFFYEATVNILTRAFFSSFY